MAKYSPNRRSFCGNTRNIRLLDGYFMLTSQLFSFVLSQKKPPNPDLISHLPELSAQHAGGAVALLNPEIHDRMAGTAAKSDTW